MKKSIYFLVLLLLFCQFSNAEIKHHVKISAVIDKSTIKKNETFNVKVDFKIDKFYHSYPSKEQLGPEGIGPTATEFKIKPEGFAIIEGKIFDPKGHTSYDEQFKMNVTSLEGNVSFIMQFKAIKDIDVKKNNLLVNVYYQVCDTTKCINEEEDVKVSFGKFEINSKDKTDATLINDHQINDVKGKNIEDHTSAIVPNSKIIKEPKPETTESQKEINDAKKKGIWSFIWLTIIAGCLSFLTPCVYPMIPITVSFFTKRAEKDNHKPLFDASIFALGIILTFVSLGFLLTAIFGPTGIRDFATHGLVNLIITLIFILFALNLFGAFEIQIPVSILNLLNKKSSEGNGIISILLMGLTFSLTSFTCTVPYVSGAFYSASNGNWTGPIFGMLIFSAVFSFPFFLLALFPTLMKKMPKSGGWMNNIKVVMGFLEIAAAIKFISNADLVWEWGILSRDLFISIWIGSGLLISTYILGLFKFKLDSNIERVGAIRVMFSIFFLSFTIYLFTGLHGNSLGELDAFLPPINYLSVNSANSVNTHSSNTGETKNINDKKEDYWYSNYNEALAIAKKENKPLFIDFTGWTCTNCRWMESNAFPRPEIHSLMNKMVLLRLYTDKRKEPEESNKKMQISRYGSIELPLYVILKPNEELVGTKAFTRNMDDFRKFLEKAFQGYN